MLTVPVNVSVSVCCFRADRIADMTLSILCLSGVCITLIRSASFSSRNLSSVDVNSGQLGTPREPDAIGVFGFLNK